MPDAPVRPNWTVQFSIDYSSGQPRIGWGQNRQPFTDEMMTFLSQLQVRAFRLCAVMAQIEDGSIAPTNQEIERPKLEVVSGNGTNGG